MPPDRIEASLFSPDIREFIGLLHKHQVRYLVVGGEAVIYYGYARLTGDVDFFFGADEENARRLYAALDEFWDRNIPGLGDWTELMEQGLILQFGRPPHRIDLLNQIDGVPFQEAWAARHETRLVSEAGEVPLYYIAQKHLLQNKEVSRRPKDLEDVQYLKSAGGTP